MLLFNSEVDLAPTAPGEQFLDILGDDMYVRTSGKILVTRDRKTWTPDTAGLSGFLQALAMDSSQNVHAGTSAGLFKQAPKGETWEKVPSFTGYVTRIFIDRADRIHVSTLTGSMMQVSKDGGKTFEADTAGIGRKSPTGYGDDVHGNAYALLEPDLVYRRKPGSAAWERVGKGLGSLSGGLDGGTVLHGIQGDSVVALWTQAGLYLSADQGGTFKRNAIWFRAATAGKVLQGKDGSIYASTSIGMYRRKSGETAWKRVLPDSGFLGYRPLFEDGTGKLFSLGRKIPGRNLQMPLVKDGPEGTWTPDTAGLSAFTFANAPLGRDGHYYVDPSGVQHLGDAWGPSNATALYLKKPGEAWAHDSAGIPKCPGVSCQPLSWGADKDGNLYVSLSAGGGLLFTRSATGAWALDTAGIGKTTVYAFAPGKDGKVWAGGIGPDGPLFYREGGKWKKADLPRTDMFKSAAFTLAVDASGTLFVGFSDFTGAKNRSQGVFTTEDAGKNWALVGLRNITPKALFPVGSKVYATTYNQGVYVLDKGKPVGLQPRSGRSLQLKPGLRSRPFAVRKTLVLELVQAGRVRADIVDVGGRKRKTVFDGLMPAGRQVVAFDAGGLEAGVYLLELRQPGMPRPAWVKFIR